MPEPALVNALVINPGSTSTKIAIFKDSRLLAAETLEHENKMLRSCPKISAQFNLRKMAIDTFLEKNSPLLKEMAVIAGRGGLLRPIKCGTYAVNQKMLDDLASARYGEHASNLGAPLAKYYSEILKIPAFVVDPVTVDEFDEASRLSGFPGISRKSRLHALNIRAAARRFASKENREFTQLNLVVAHLGGGISVCSIKEGRIIDSTDALLGEGPFSLERSGTLPLTAVVELCFEHGLSKQQVVEMLSRQAGFKGYYGVDRLPDVYSLIDAGNREAELLLEAMLRQVSKWIGAMSAVLRRESDGIILTGGMLNSERLLNHIIKYINHLGRVVAFPGEFEMEALAEGAMRVLKGSEPILEY